jgi:hypothetical protein
MHLLVLERGRFEVLAVADAGPASGATGGSSEVVNFLLEGDPNFVSSARGMLGLFQRYAQAGRQKLPAAVFHEADRSAGVWQFIKGRLRVFCFIDDGAVVVLTHGAVKKSQKADRSEVEKAGRLRAAYLAAKAAGAITMEDWSGGR